MENLGENPFSQLFPSLELALQYRQLQAHSSTDSTNTGKGSVPPAQSPTTSSMTSPTSPTVVEDSRVKHVQMLNTCIEEVFLFTLNKFSVVGGEHHHLVFLSSLADIIGTHNQSWLELSSLEQALFERIMLEQPANHVVSRDGSRSTSPSHLTETRLVVYLLESYRRCYNIINRENSTVDLVNDLLEIKNLIILNLSTAFREPDLYFGQNLTEQLTELLVDSYEVEDCLADFMEKFALKIKTDEGSTAKLEEVMRAVLANIKGRLAATSMIIFSSHTVVPVMYFLKSPLLARILVQYSLPAQLTSGKSYEETLLGTILAKSCLPQSDMGPWDFFIQPSGQPASVHSRTEAQIWSGLESVHSAGHTILLALLRSDEDVKHLLLTWLGECLAANSGRGKMWTSQMGPLLAGGYASDGFMLNLGSCLLRLCGPMCKDEKKMSRVDPTYCAKVTVVSEDARLSGVHTRDLHTQTCLTTLQPEGSERPTVSTYNFPTEVFFMTHRALDLGFRTVQEKFVKLNQELNRLQGAYRDAVGGGGGPAAEQIQERMEQAMSRYLSMKAALLEPSTLESQTALVAATSTWLVTLATGSANPWPIDSMNETPPGLSCVPEFVIENLCEHLLLVKRFNPAHFEQCGHRLPAIFNLILVYMGKPCWLRNPHLRARLAESLECLLPHHENQGQPNILGNYQRQALFQDNPSRLNLATAILHVFVSIEETGQSVEFEQKFSYRRPMYDVIKYIWTLDQFKLKFAEMAETAELQIESEVPPLFLRFINLLVNDAIFLLDEGLNYMRTLQEQEGDKERWQSLPAQERSDLERQYAHTGQLARYHNIMGSETIGVLELMTGSIKSVITHPTMADRLAAMLNYFLKTLTGPERKSFKVKNLDQYSFKPGEVVVNITQIYVNLRGSDTFLASVSKDGRSYSPELFDWTETVLLRIGRADLASGLQEIAAKVASASSQQAEEEDLLADAPDEFLCPIMSIIMLDPVTLPSSKKIVDRSTIARHLLSDQSDPFNRSPLTMDQVKTDEELKTRVHDWIRSKKESQ